MEASRKPQTVADKLAEFKARYPRERFIWVNAPLETAGEWPEHYGLGARVFKVPTDNIVKYTNKNGKVSQQNGWIYELNGMWALSKPSKLQIMHDAGVIFSRDQLHRLDDGSDPDVCEFEGAAAILSISGLNTVSGRKRIDLKTSKSVFSREFLIENCETKLELRLGWKLVGLPQAFTMSELQAKEFVTFCVFSAPHAINPEERMLILRHHLGIWGPAFGDARPIEIGTVEAPRQIGVPRQPAVELEGAEVEDDELVAGAPEASFQLTPDEAPKKAPLDPNFLQAVGERKKDFIGLLGEQEGTKQYYEILGASGYKHANEIADPEHKRAVYLELEKRVRLLRENKAALPAEPAPESAAPPPADPLASFMAARRASLGRMSMERIQDELDDMLKTYPKDDPQGIVKRLPEAKSKDGLIDLAMELYRWGVEEAGRIRERINARQGGER